MVAELAAPEGVGEFHRELVDEVELAEGNACAGGRSEFAGVEHDVEGAGVGDEADGVWELPCPWHEEGEAAIALGRFAGGVDEHGGSALEGVDFWGFVHWEFLDEGSPATVEAAEERADDAEDGDGGDDADEDDPGVPVHGAGLLGWLVVWECKRRSGEEAKKNP